MIQNTNKTLRVLFFGDIFGKPGREAIRSLAPQLFEKHKPDFVLANVENIAHGSGITPATLAEIDALGIFHAYTTGNHVWKKSEVETLLGAGGTPLLRPLNYPAHMPGSGARVVAHGAQRLLVINIMGRVFMKEEAEVLSNPFSALDEALQRYTLDPQEDGKEYVQGIFVDVHAEATSEKRALGLYSDGRVSAVVGTHTHVPTRDEQILPKGTAYISDVGMVGPLHSSLGLDIEGIIQEFLTEESQKREVSDTPQVEVGAVLIDIGGDGHAQHIEHIRQIVPLA
jgi:2',3'-cyclic-nucleotide 2'-phosphodiesterase